ncbi:MAG: hypothetical protein QOJ71_1448 [Actinomycetota bacterium]|nr:hypothetical protein [Actinomycetota bacterium]
MNTKMQAMTASKSVTFIMVREIEMFVRGELQRPCRDAYPSPSRTPCTFETVSLGLTL